MEHAGVAAVDALPQGAGTVTVVGGQHSQVAVQALCIAGLQVVVQQHAGSRAIGHGHDPHTGSVQPLDQCAAQLAPAQVVGVGHVDAVVVLPEVRRIQRVGHVEAMQVFGIVLLYRVGHVGSLPGGNDQLARSLGGSGLRRGGSDFLGGLIVVQKVLQGLDIHDPVRVVHQAVVHAGADAVGTLQRHRHLLHIAAQKARQLHKQGGDLGLGKVRLDQRQHGVQQAVQFHDAGVFHLVQHGLDDGALTLDALPVVVDLAQTCVLQRRVAVKVVEARVNVVDNKHRVGGDLPVQRLGLLFGDVDIDAADGIHDLDKGVEIDANIVVDLDVEAVLDGFHRQLGATVAEGVGDPVVLVLVAIQQNRYAGAAFDGDKADDMILDVQRNQNHAVGAGIIAELGRILGAVQLVQVGEGIGIVDGLGAFVGTNEQDVQHVVVRERASLGHRHLFFGVGQAGAVQVLVLARVNIAHFFHAAVVVAQQVELAVDVQPGHGRQHRHDRCRNYGDTPGPRQAAPEVGL